MAKWIFIALVSVVALVSCKQDPITNPYDGIVVVNNDNPSADEIPIGNFAWIHAKVFRPTCANSGCHDGTFEPHFNTIASAYNSLVNHPVIANDVGGTYSYRVAPGNANLSFLIARLTIDIPNTSGVMPLELEPESDWPTTETAYISHIENWINNGAPDMFGNLAGDANGDFPPQVTGIVAFPSGNTTTPYPREGEGNEVTPILVDNGSVDLWFLATDDNTAASDLTSTELKVSQDLDDFSSATSSVISIQTAITAQDFGNNQANFIHRSTIDLSAGETGDIYFLRTYWDDGIQTTVTEIPTDGSSDYVKALFVLKIN